ncbi:RHS repeat-associated core domain-containing protein [Mucilaginibacter dorajii]|uniref:DUF6443 domain-containing protein n=1 Tax=Mucilaginibacter dorajii TaxID=692994 RepID=A0ABP7PRD7_9SPHI|nr:RHS repeat-associated core domain-containing protein [Mucilaginibacter dorajii]MCS3736384.1 RHS repeat-associated protein [Mucilaginibacter dorajii]
MESHQKTYYKWLLLAGMVITGNATQAQTTMQNYVRTRVPRVAITRNTRLDSLTGLKDSVMTSIQYVDGLGRPLQTVQQQASTVGNDIILPSAYDSYGREAVKYLPYVNTSTSYGSYRGDALGATTGVKAYYNPTSGTVEGKQTNGVVLTQFPFAVTAFEASPLGRPLEQGAPGAAWQVNGTPSDTSSNHTVKSVMTINDQSGFSSTNITTNTGSRKVALYTAPINANGSRSLIRAGGNTATYPNNQLMVTISRDENWKPSDGCFGTTETYKDKEGHVVLKRSYNINGATAEMLSTYYVYDDLGNLCFVLPPGASPDISGTAISQTTIDTKCYQYRYDARGRLFQKKVPGKGWEFMIYNKLDQPIATQDSVQRMKSPQEWTITKYDAMGRPILTGVYYFGTTGNIDYHVGVQAAADTVTALWENPVTTGNGYTGNAWPKSFSITLSATYYDVYSGIPGLSGVYNQSANALYSSHNTGLVTATKTLVLNTTGDYLWSAFFYDKEAKVIRTFSQHYLGGSSALSQYNYDDVSTVYSFTKQVLSNVRLHYYSNAGKTAAIRKLQSVEAFSYDHMGRRRSTSSQLRDSTNALQDPVRISLAIYNELGQLTRKGLHSINGTSNFLQVVDYRYNARGWLTNINNGSLSNDPLTSTDTNDQFGEDLKYDDAATPQYNGNIGSVKTLTGSVAGASYPALTYNYSYDKLNRLLNAISTTTTANDGFFNEKLSYDNMGNIQTLYRYDRPGGIRTAIDSLNYTYIGNRVDRIDDAGTTAGFTNGAGQTGEYLYDGNGNQVTDLNKGLTQQYNMLNLPQTAVKGSTSLAYIYDAGGRKLRKLTTTGSTTTVTEYINGIEYDYTGSTPVLSFIQTEEGRARKKGTVYKYEYDLKDHLGNTRVTTTWDSTNTNQLVPYNIGKNDYYAFGFTIASTAYSGNPKNLYLYNHKELQDETGLYDYGARLYDPVVGRWTSVDPLAEKYPTLSSYAYVANSPVILNDKDGRDWEWNWTRDKKGAINGLNLTLNGKILDRTGSYSSKQLGTLKSDYVNGIQSMLKGSIGKGFSITTTANLSVVTSTSDVKATDHLINIISNADMAASQGAAANGLGEVGGLNIWMTQRSVDNTLKTGSAREIGHELGHTGGLMHPDEQGPHPQVFLPNDGYDFGPNVNNFMWGSQAQMTNYYGMNPQDRSKPAANFGENNTYVDPNQLWSGIFSNLINHKLNQQYGRPAVPDKKSNQ